MVDDKKGGSLSKKSAGPSGMKQTGPHLEVSAAKPKKNERSPENVEKPANNGAETPEIDKSPVSEVVQRDEIVREIDEEELNGAFIVCAHVAEQMDMETLKKLTKKFGVDLDKPPVDSKVAQKEMKRRIAAWKRCPNRLDFRNVCRDPLTGQTCPVVQAFMTPQPRDPRLVEQTTRLPPGTIGVGTHQVAFHSGSKWPSTNDPHFLELGRLPDGTMSVSVQYAADPRPPPEYLCTTVRQTQASLEPGAQDTSGSKKKGKGKKEKAGKKKKSKK